MNNLGKLLLFCIELDLMAIYSIKDLEQLSGIKAHTIRIWEKRYNLFNPTRTSGNVRRYSDQDLRQLMNISQLNKSGYKISKILELPEDDIAALIKSISYGNSGSDAFVDKLVAAMIALDEFAFNRAFSNAILKFGFERTITDVIYPFLEKIGVLWQVGSISPAHEHFASNLIRQKLIVAIDSESRQFIPGYKTFVLFLPEGELHEFGLLFYYYVLRKAGHKVVYLGQSIPYDYLKEICSLYKNVELMLTFVKHMPVDDVQAYLDELSVDFAESPIYLFGAYPETLSLKYSSNISFIPTIDAFKQHIYLI